MKVIPCVQTHLVVYSLTPASAPRGGGSDSVCRPWGRSDASAFPPSTASSGQRYIKWYSDSAGIATGSSAWAAPVVCGARGLPAGSDVTPPASLFSHWYRTAVSLRSGGGNSTESLESAAAVAAPAAGSNRT